MTLTRRAALASAAAVSSFAIIGRARAEDTVKIGVCSPLTGAAAEVGRIQLNSLKLSAEQVNARGGILGRKVELIIEDDATTNPGVVLAFSRLAANPDIVAFIGSIRSTQVNAMAPDVARIGKPVMFGGTDPTLTHNGYKWLFRCRPNDSFSARVIADFGVKTLDKKKWAIVASTDAFGTGGKLGTGDFDHPVAGRGDVNLTGVDDLEIIRAGDGEGHDAIASTRGFQDGVRQGLCASRQSLAEAGGASDGDCPLGGKLSRHRAAGQIEIMQQHR